MYHAILAPLDQSERAAAIMPHVEALARCFNAAVVLLTVVDIEVESPLPPLPPRGLLPGDPSAVGSDQLASAARLYLEGWRERLSRQGINTRIRIEYGPVAAAILETAATENVDLIAMAGHGRTGLARVFYGSVTEEVLQKADRPMLIIHTRS